MINKQYISKTEHQSFLKTWFYNTNEELEFYDSLSNSTIKLKNTDLLSFYENFLRSYDANKSHKIVGCDVMKHFSISLSSREVWHHQNFLL